MEYNLIDKIVHNKRFNFCFIMVFIFGLVAHGYCYFNLLYSHDSLIMFQNDFIDQIALGRIFHPFMFWLRGNFYVPSLVGFLSLFYLSLVVYLITKLFKINNKLYIGLISGILVTDIALTLTNATYIHDSDIYMCSLLFSVLGVYVLRSFKYGYLFTPLLFSFSLGLYQSYFQVGVFLLMMLLLLDTIHVKDYKTNIKNIIKYVVVLLVSLIFYYLLVKLFLLFYEVNINTGYNGISRVGQYSGIKDILFNFLRTYYTVYKQFIWDPITYDDYFVSTINIFIVIAMGYYLVKIVLIKKLKGWNLFLLCSIVAFMPFGINVVQFISKGMEHELMMYSFCLIYVLAIVLLLEYYKLKKWNLRQNVLMPLGLGIVIFSSIVLANQCYYNKDLQYQNTLLTINRILARIETTEGYQVGRTPVIFYGNLDDSPIGVDYKFGFYRMGFSHNYAITYYDTYELFIRDNLHYNLLVLDEEEIKRFDEKEIKDMGIYPEEDSIKYIDGVIVVKLSNKQKDD